LISTLRKDLPILIETITASPTQNEYPVLFSEKETSSFLLSGRYPYFSFTELVRDL
jgi:hypothetical protein